MNEVNKAIMMLHSLIECPKLSAATRRELETKLLSLVDLMIERAITDEN
jgi:hypothetical protein